MQGELGSPAEHEAKVGALLQAPHKGERSEEEGPLDIDALLANKHPILIEGMDPKQIIELKDLELYAATDRPIIISVGSAEVLAQIRVSDDVLFVEIAVADRGGEGVLKVLVNTIEKSARQRNIHSIEWSIYARNCAIPNLKLTRILFKIGFEVRTMPSGSEFFWKRLSSNQSLARGK